MIFTIEDCLVQIADAAEQYSLELEVLAADDYRAKISLEDGRSNGPVLFLVIASGKVSVFHVVDDQPKLLFIQITDLDELFAATTRWLDRNLS